MKKIILFVIAQLFLASTAFSIDFTFSSQDFLVGASWGTLSVNPTTSDTLLIKYSAAPESLLSGVSEGAEDLAKVTGFAFTFLDPYVVQSLSNPDAGQFADDLDNLDWAIDPGLNSTLAGVYNGDEFNPEITKFDFEFAVTEDGQGSAGIKPGEIDYYYLTFTGIDLLQVNLPSFVELTGIRLQALSNDVNEGSLFLAGHLDDGGGGGGGGDPIPEPSTLILLGAGLVGLAVYRRKKN